MDERKWQLFQLVQVVLVLWALLVGEYRRARAVPTRLVGGYSSRWVGVSAAGGRR